MRRSIAIVHNDPALSRYGAMGEGRAVLEVMDTVHAVHRVLEDLGHAVTRVALSPPLEAAKARLLQIQADVVFNLFEGFSGRPQTEAAIAYILAGMGRPYTGCPAMALAVALDKMRAKAVLEAGGVRTPAAQVLTPASVGSFGLRYPCIVKPCAEDASHGITADSVVHDSAGLARQVDRIGSVFGGRALVEEYIEGREFNATVMGMSRPLVLPISEIRYSLPSHLPRILSFASKWDCDSIDFRGSRPCCPAELSAGELERINDAALLAFACMGCSGYARIDFRMDAAGILYVIEVNPNPDIAPDSGAARQARVAGMSYPEFIGQIVAFAVSGEAEWN